MVLPPHRMWTLPSNWRVQGALSAELKQLERIGDQIILP